ncbi:hypothetical protein [Leptospira ilyithenensis]|uniref:hypothetical protein n=1 Tax=Leptospira ilyithenensis TaxID=2484901 RepID=UPI0014383D96|nr:hypothetical protein [Leptospira ilyithenensis]
MSGKVVKNSDLKDQLKQMQELTKKVTASKVSTKAYLAKTGIYTKSGQLKSAFKK